MTRTHRYTIQEQVYPPPSPGTRYRIIESYPTLDGFRSRLTNQVSDDLDSLRGKVFQLETGHMGD